jgi:hypothetical protein
VRAKVSEKKITHRPARCFTLQPIF